MSYSRVIPRDLFNEADLLKCYAKLALILMETDGHRASLGESHDGEPFKISQDPSDDSLVVDNISLLIAGYHASLARPLNSREPWSLMLLAGADSPDQEEMRIFDKHGDLSPEFWDLIKID